MNGSRVGRESSRARRGAAEVAGALLFRVRPCARALAPLLCLAAIATLSAAPPSECAHVVILATTDVHGNIDPIDYDTDREDARGLARAATVIREQRRQDPELILLDAGDTIQGTPLTYYHARKDNRPRDPMALVMSAIGYDAMTVGNHEYEYGLDVLAKARGESAFPWLSANTYRRGTDEPYFQPYLVKQVCGVRVGILGLTTTGVPNVQDPGRVFSQIEIREPLKEAARWGALLREKERADVMVALVHMGFEEDLETGETLPGQIPGENAAAAIARDVPGVDVIVMGHTHRDWPALLVNGVLLTQAEKWARRVARVDLYLDRGEVGGRWRVAAKAARTIPVGEHVGADRDIVRLAEPYHRAVEAWLDEPVATAPVELSAEGQTIRDTALMDLVHRVQLDAGHADVSLAPTVNPNARIARGLVTVRDLFGLYEYDRVLVVLEVTGRQLKDALEHSAVYFRPYVPGKSAAELVDPRFPIYDFETAAGVTYTLDISKPPGERITGLRFRGQPLDPGRKLRLATNNYRANGAAGFTMLQGAPVVYRSGADLREVIVEWVRRNGEVPATVTGNWRVAP